MFVAHALTGLLASGDSSAPLTSGESSDHFTVIVTMIGSVLLALIGMLTTVLVQGRRSKTRIDEVAKQTAKVAERTETVDRKVTTNHGKELFEHIEDLVDWADATSKRLAQIESNQTGIRVEFRVVRDEVREVKGEVQETRGEVQEMREVQGEGVSTLGQTVKSVQDLGQRVSAVEEREKGVHIALADVTVTQSVDSAEQVEELKHMKEALESVVPKMAPRKRAPRKAAAQKSTPKPA